MHKRYVLRREIPATRKSKQTASSLENNRNSSRTIVNRVRVCIIINGQRKSKLVVSGKRVKLFRIYCNLSEVEVYARDARDVCIISRNT